MTHQTKVVLRRAVVTMALLIHSSMAAYRQSATDLSPASGSPRILSAALSIKERVIST